jgi:hypothetical protein
MVDQFDPTPCLPLPISKAVPSLKEYPMHPALLVAIPAGLIILGMILNSISIVFDQPASSPETDPATRIEADNSALRKLFERHRSRTLARQRNIGRYGWLVLIAVIGSSIWVYLDTVEKTTLRNQVVALQTLGADEGKEMVLSLTTSDGGNVKYIIKQQKSETPVGAAKNIVAAEKVSKWEMEKLGTLVSTGDNPLTFGVALKISN